MLQGMRKREKKAYKAMEAYIDQSATILLNASLNTSSEGGTSGKIDGEELGPREEYDNVFVLSSEVPMMTLRTAGT